MLVERANLMDKIQDDLMFRDMIIIGDLEKLRQVLVERLEI
jgi:hypothetical protein